MTKLFKYLNLIILLLMTSVSYAETNNCTAITTLPFDIAQPGVYCLTGNLSSNWKRGSAIRIRASDVTIDLNGFTLSGLRAGSATKAVGIYANKRSNCTIRNGTIRGFYQGVLLFDANPYITARGHLVEDLLVEKSTFNGIQVNGAYNIVRNNRVADTGHSTFSSGLKAFGIQVWGASGRVINNDVSNTTADSRADGFGIVIGSADSSIVKGNRVNDVNSDMANTYGLFISSSDNVLVRGNNFISMDSGIYYSNGSGKNMDNLTTNVTIPFTGGDSAGIND